MKKLTTLFILVFLSVGLFASPKVPKTNNSFKSSESLSADDCLVYVNNSGQNIYRLFGEVTDHSTLWFSNESLVTGIKIVFAINFQDEITMDGFIAKFTTYDLERCFNELRESFMDSDITPIIIEGEQNKVKEVLYLVSF